MQLSVSLLGRCVFVCFRIFVNENFQLRALLYRAWGSKDWILWETANRIWRDNNQSWPITTLIYRRMAGWTEANCGKFPSRIDRGEGIQTRVIRREECQYTTFMRRDVTRTRNRSQNSWSPSWVPPAYSRQAPYLRCINCQRTAGSNIYFWHSFAAHRSGAERIRQYKIHVPFTYSLKQHW